MAHLQSFFFGQKRATSFRLVDLGTRSAWTEAHRKGAAKTAGFAQALIVAGLLLLSGAVQAQEMAAPSLITQTSEGGTQELPLVYERLRVVIDQGHAQTEFHHAFQNETGQSLEGSYQIALGTVAQATGFHYYVGETKIVGEIFEKEAARQVYEAVTGTGRDPGLLEQSGEGVFSFRVAPIAPGEKKRIGVSTSQLLRQTGTTLEYQAPLGRDGAGSTIELIDTRDLDKIWSPTHEFSETKTKRGRELRVLKKKGSSDRLILKYRVVEKDFEITAAVHRTAGHDGYVFLSLAAPEGLTQKKTPRDVTLVIDRSGSMTGSPLSAARNASKAVLGRLREDDFVNVVSFDDGTDALFGEPRLVKDARKEALSFVDSIEAGGGTDLALALSEAFRRMPAKGRPSVVLFLTDGESDPAAALKAAESAPKGVRLYTVGIGAGVDRPLLSRLAREHGGRFTYVADEKNLERDVEHLFARTSEPVLSDLKISVEGAQVKRMYPRTSSDLFFKDQLTFAIRATPDSKKSTARLKIVGTREGKTHVLQKSLNLAPAHKPWVGRAWATQRVDDLLEQMSLSGETPELKNEAIELALAYDLVTRYTSFLAIPESEITENVRGTMEQERERRVALLKKHKDAAALSRTVMPPGDPVITVRAPGSSQGVTAVFSFGKVLDLSYVPEKEVWEGRFLVPNHIADGAYDVQVFVVSREGEVSQTTTNYEIDSRAPAFEIAVTEEPGGATLKLTADEKLREVRVTALDADSKRGARLSSSGRACAPSGCAFSRQNDTEFEVFLDLPPGKHRLRVVVTDEARNESIREIELVVDADGEGC